LLWQINLLEARTGTELTPGDRNLLGPMIEEARTQVYQMELDAAKGSVALVRGRLEVLKRIEQIEQLLAGRDPGRPVIGLVRDLIVKARQQVQNGADQQAAQTMAEIEQNLNQGAKAAMMGPGDQADQQLVNAAQQARAAQQIAGQAVQGPAPLGFVGTRKFLGRLTGLSQEIMAEATLWVARPLLYVTLIGVLVFLGLEQLFIKNPTFGASPFLDYTGLMFWAMSSDVASRTLSNIRGSA
jgi:hypothetical protein